MQRCPLIQSRVAPEAQRICKLREVEKLYKKIFVTITPIT